MVKRKKKKDPFGLAALLPAAPFLKAPEAETTFFFKGFDSILEKYKDVDTDTELEDAKKKMEAALKVEKETGEPLIVRASPLTPTEGKEAAEAYTGMVDLATAGAILAMIAAEAASLGQLDISITQVLRHPILAAAIDAATRVHAATLMEGVYPAYRYHILKDYQPLRADAKTLADLYARGFMNEDTYLDQIEYQGYDMDEAAKLANAAFRYPGLNELLTLFRRGEITEDEFKVYLRRQGLIPDAVDDLTNLRWLKADARTLADLCARGIMPLDTFLDQMKDLGYDTNEALKLVNTAFRYPGLNELLTLFRRGIIHGSTFQLLLRRQGMHPAYIADLSNLRWQLPGYMDIISVYMREGYMPDKWVEIPEEFVDYMKQLGYSEFWAKRLWGKHWVLPGVTLLYDMFHKKIIDKDTMVQMLKYHDFEPVWRERLIENAYEMIPRVDLRRAYRYGMLRPEDLAERYEWLGYKPEDAKLMAGLAERWSLDRYYTRLETVARAAYRKGKLSREGLLEILRQINTPDEAVDLVLQAEEIAREAAVREPGEDVRTLTASQVLSLYRKSLITREYASERLADMGYPDKDISLLLSLAAPSPEPEEVNRDLVTAASMLYREGLLSQDEFKGYLRKAGLSEEDVSRKVEAENLRYRLDYARDLIALIKEAYKKDVYTAEEAVDRLIQFGMVPERATALIAREQLRKMPKPRAD